MRIVTRPDFDGIVCAALLYDVEDITAPILWVQPSDIQKGLVPLEQNDIIANLPFSEGCKLWFDHHISNRPKGPITGAFEIMPSAARVIFNHYKGRFKKDYDMLIQQTDDIDSANLTSDQVRHPERYPHVLLSMTISGQNPKDAPYWNNLVQLLRRIPIQDIIADSEVETRCKETVAQNIVYENLLSKHTHCSRHVAVTDFRPLWPPPEGNRFLVYSLYPETSVSVKIRYADPDLKNINISVGRSIFNKTCRVNVGMMLSQFGGGGHSGAGACNFPAIYSDEYISNILNILDDNQEMED
jgi:hypothetical protein